LHQFGDLFELNINSGDKSLTNWSLQEIILSVKVKFTPVSNLVPCPLKIQSKSWFLLYQF
jgi:hypothetical protein